jgi:hypothetical protein
VETWEVKAAGADNHYLDAEVYAAVAADLMQVRYLDDGVQPAAPPVPRAAARTDQPGGWLGGREGKAWL